MTGGVDGLRRFLQPRPAAPGGRAETERCELCATPVPAEHQHLVNISERSIRCACRPCALLFADRTREIGGVGFRTIPDRYLYDPDFTLSDAQWDSLQIPVAMAFFFLNSASVLNSNKTPVAPLAPPASGETGEHVVVACYPSPAGATESELDLGHWSDGVGAGRLADVLEPDVEALLVRRRSAERRADRAAADQTECLLVPVDACYRLVGLVRRHWKGFDGGTEAWAAIDTFFDEVRGRARVLRVPPGPASTTPAAPVTAGSGRGSS